jgi:hypothetical protein
VSGKKLTNEMAGAAIPNSNFLELETFDLSFNLTPLNGT